MNSIINVKLDKGHGSVIYSDKEMKKIVVVDGTNYKKKIKHLKLLDASDTLVRDKLNFVDFVFNAEYTKVKNRSHQVSSGLDDVNVREIANKNKVYFFDIKKIKTLLNNKLNNFDILSKIKQNIILFEKYKVNYLFINSDKKSADFFKEYFSKI